MVGSMLPSDLAMIFCRPGSSVLITSFGNPHIDMEEQQTFGGEIERLWISEETLFIRLKWIGQKNHETGTWHRVTDERMLDFRAPLAFFRASHMHVAMCYVFQPQEPKNFSQVFLYGHDYIGQPGEWPLKQEDMLV